MEQILHVGREGADAFVREFCCGKSVALVTDGPAYSLSGAAAFFDQLLPEVNQLVVKTPNPKVGEIQILLDQLGVDKPDAFIAVGGGTAMDTAKLLNFAVSADKTVQQILESDSCPVLHPYMAVPTTAGTGAEATRFAVCYEGEKKHSIDFPEIRPSHVLLLSELTDSLPLYQTMCTGFDAYAQAIESLWATGATLGSTSYAREAKSILEIMLPHAVKFLRSEHPIVRMNDASEYKIHTLCDVRRFLMRGAYLAGQAIDISRTTAAHAFSYYLTSHYGIPHGHAVYMCFPYVLKANAECEAFKKKEISIKRIDEVLRALNECGLMTLRQFCEEKGIGWDQMVDELFANVNLKRLGNNPCEVRREHFNG